MRRTALALATALVLGAGAGFFVHTGMAGDAEPEGASLSRVKSSAHPLRAQPQLRVPHQETRSAAPTRLWIPRLDLRSRIFAASRLNNGPAWWPITGRPGGGDTIAVAGHRTTHSRPFYFLERLQRGDRIQIAYLGRTYAYRVMRTRVISAKNLHMADAVGYERLLLTACTPRGSAQFRLLVEAMPA